MVELGTTGAGGRTGWRRRSPPNAGRSEAIYAHCIGIQLAAKTVTAIDGFSNRFSELISPQPAFPLSGVCWRHQAGWNSSGSVLL